MNCERCQENLSAFIDEELVAEMQTEIHEHLQNCSACRTEWHELRRIDARLQRLSLPANGAVNALNTVSNRSVVATESHSLGMRDAAVDRSNGSLPRDYVFRDEHRANTSGLNRRSACTCDWGRGNPGSRNGSLDCTGAAWSHDSAWVSCADFTQFAV